MTKQELTAARLTLNYSRADLARELGVSRQHVSRMEHGKRAISKITELAVRYLLLRDGFSAASAQQPQED